MLPEEQEGVKEMWGDKANYKSRGVHSDRICEHANKTGNWNLQQNITEDRK